MKYNVTLGSYPIGLDPELTGPVPRTVRVVELCTDAGLGCDIWKGYCRMRQDAGGETVGWPPYTTISLPEDAPEIKQFEEAINFFVRFLVGCGCDTCDRVVKIELASDADSK